MRLFQLKQVSKHEGNAVVFPKIDLTIKQGDLLAIQVHHDLAKLLVNMITGRTGMSTGEVLLHGQPLPQDFKKFSNRIGLCLLEDAVYERLTLEEYLRFAQDLYQLEIDEGTWLQKMNLADKARWRISRLTYAEKRRLQLARAMQHEPDLLILEEPDQQIDLESKLIIQRVLEEFKDQDKAILILTSNLESAVSMADQVYRLKRDGLKQLDLIDREGGEPEVQAEEDLTGLDGGQGSAGFSLQIEKIPAKLDDKIILFDPTEIMYIESQDGLSHLHVNREQFPCSLTLNQLHERLEAFGFFRCHRSYIVNLQKVREVVTWTRNSYSLVLDDRDQTTIPLSKGRFAEFKTILNI